MGDLLVPGKVLLRNVLPNVKKILLMFKKIFDTTMFIYCVLRVYHTGDVALGGKKIGERPGHFDDKRKPDGFDTKQIFVSPSIRYAGHNAYATPAR